ncbi:hypothetical protein [Anaerorhabdus furcosa]|uniref:Uncharacterized protein n=1 Tax=Anaerorhabdus furcosa TaxID=118967 RepID=A0A1T4K0X4_9FIRM|nr:hypothetical protein [Anaerorhabdus furcosa]SJZ36100.1 hypothetical protein SAMN02745191_0229 [Anaerorhabdus furcosa]
MLKVFNTEALSRNQRFQRGVLAGIIATIVLMIGYGWLSQILRIEFSVAFLLIGYAIGWAIRTYGRGVQLKFSILGAICAVVCFIGADMISYFGFGVFTDLNLFIGAFQTYLRILLNVNFNSLLGILFRVGGVYAAFYSSRIV